MNDPFEQRLSQLPRRKIPADWREDILSGEGGIRTPGFSLTIFWTTLRGLLWPHPYAWAGLAALWLLIATLDFSGPRGSALYVTEQTSHERMDAAIERYAAYLILRNQLPQLDHDIAADTHLLNRKDL